MQVRPGPGSMKLVFCLTSIAVDYVSEANQARLRDCFVAKLQAMTGKKRLAMTLPFRHCEAHSAEAISEEGGIAEKRGGEAPL